MGATPPGPSQTRRGLRGATSTVIMAPPSAALGKEITWVTHSNHRARVPVQYAPSYALGRPHSTAGWAVDCGDTHLGWVPVLPLHSCMAGSKSHLTPPAGGKGRDVDAAPDVVREQTRVGPPLGIGVCGHPMMHGSHWGLAALSGTSLPGQRPVPSRSQLCPLPHILSPWGKSSPHGTDRGVTQGTRSLGLCRPRLAQGALGSGVPHRPRAHQLLSPPKRAVRTSVSQGPDHAQRH